MSKAACREAAPRRGFRCPMTMARTIGDFRREACRVKRSRNATARRQARTDASVSALSIPVLCSLPPTLSVRRLRA